MTRVMSTIRTLLVAGVLTIPAPAGAGAPALKPSVGPSVKPAEAADPLTVRCLRSTTAAEARIAACSAGLAAASLAPDRQARLRVALGEGYLDAGRYGEALAEARKALSLDAKAPGARLLQAQAENSMGQHDAALADLDAVIADEPGNVDALVLRGLIWQADKHDLDKAERDFDKAIAVGSASPWAHFYKAMAANERGDFAAALVQLDLALKLSPLDARVRLAKGTVYENLGQWDKAIAVYDGVLRGNPQNAKALVNRAVARGNSGDYPGALADCVAALAIEPGNARAYRVRGAILANRDELIEAQAAYEKALTIETR
jgi:tetratricopeptide (TPR) repeat protein